MVVCRKRVLDKSIAISSGVITSVGEFEKLEKTGHNNSKSSVMAVAATSCKYGKYNEKGCF